MFWDEQVSPDYYKHANPGDLVKTRRGIAVVIERKGPDVLVLQQINRGAWQECAAQPDRTLDPV